MSSGSSKALTIERSGVELRAMAGTGSLTQSRQPTIIGRSTWGRVRALEADEVRGTLDMATETGKRYVCSECGSEVLVTRAGDGTIKCCGQPAKPKS